MQLPDTLLAAKLPAAAKTVLTALWRSAEGEPVRPVRGVYMLRS